MKPSESWIAAQLMFEPSLVAPREHLTPRLESVIRRNRMPMAPVGDRYLEAFQGTPFEPLVRDHQAVRDKALQTFSHVAKRWKLEEIPSVLIKSPGYFPYTSDNVDVLVSRTQGPRAIELLRELGYVEIGPLREPHKLFFRNIGGDDPGFAVHLHLEVAWINTFLRGTEVMEAARWHEQYDWLGFPSPEHVALITTAHWFYEDKQLSLRDLFHMTEAVGYGVDWDAAAVAAERQGWLDGWLEALEITKSLAVALDIHSLSGLPNQPKLADLKERATRADALVAPKQAAVELPFDVGRVRPKVLHFKKVISAPSLSLAERLLEVRSLVAYAFLVKSPVRLRRMRPVIIALSGLDGSGKSTLAHELVSILTTAGVPAQYHWTRAGSSPLLDGIRVLARLFRPPAPGGSRVSDPLPELRRSQRPQLGWKVWSAVVGTDYLVRLWLLFIGARWRGGVHVFDRFALDAFVDLSLTYGVRSRLLLQLSPRADVNALLEVEPELASGRGSTPAPIDTLQRAFARYAENKQLIDLAIDTSRSDGPTVGPLRDEIAALLTGGSR